MARSRACLLLVALTALGLSGCADSETPPMDGDAPLDATDAPPQARLEDSRSAQAVYQWSGQVVGATTLDGQPAFEEPFEAPNGTVGLNVMANPGEGAGKLQVEILGPDGKVAFQGTRWTQFRAAGLTAGSRSMDEATADGLGPGNYTVRYHVTGAMDVFVRVVALFELPE